MQSLSKKLLSCSYKTLILTLTKTQPTTQTLTLAQTLSIGFFYGISTSKWSSFIVYQFLISIIYGIERGSEKVWTVSYGKVEEIVLQSMTGEEDTIKVNLVKLDVDIENKINMFNSLFNVMSNIKRNFNI